MAGEAFSGIHCAKMTIGRLHIYLASTERGALRVGLGLDDHLPPAQFFRRVFPDLQLIQDLRMNQPQWRPYPLARHEPMGQWPRQWEAPKAPGPWDRLWGETRCH